MLFLLLLTCFLTGRLVEAHNNSPNPKPQIGSHFPGVGQLGAGRATQRLVLTPRVSPRSFSADRGRSAPVLHRGPSTHSLRTDEGGRVARGLRAMRMLSRTILSGRARDDELACVEEGSLSTSSSSSDLSTTSPTPCGSPALRPRWPRATLPALSVPCTVLEPLSPPSPNSSPIHKSKSANALVGCVSHACEPVCRVLGEEELDGCDLPEPVPRLLPPVVAGPCGPCGPAQRSAAQPIHRRSSDSDLSITPKGKIPFSLSTTTRK